MRIILLRHATAIDRGSPGIADADRMLVAQGEREARNAGRALRELSVTPAAIVTSPYARARDTARIASEHLEAPVVEDPALEPGFDAEALERLVSSRAADCLVLVGHDPDFSDLVGELTGARVALAKGGVARIDAPSGPRPGACELRWLMRPKQLRLIARNA